MFATTLVLLGCALVSVVAVLTVMRRRRAGVHRIESLPPLVFEVHDRREPALRPARFRSRDGAATSPQPPGAFAPAAGAFLPGRLEITSGPHAGETLRFPVIAGGPGEFTLGRGQGTPHSHIRLPAQTADREQARLHYERGRWLLTNLSITTPTTVNGAPLLGAHDARWLENDDVVEMGELRLRFRTP